MKTYHLVVLFLLIIMLTSCIEQPPDLALVDVGRFNFRNLQRVIDSEAGVVCWIYNGRQEYGISCLPIRETLLGEQ